MGLENTFNKVEKLPEEKKLEVITSKESLADEIRAHLSGRKKMSDYKYEIMEVCEEMARQQHNKEFGELDKKAQMKIFDEVSADYFSSKIEEVEMGYSNR